MSRTRQSNDLKQYDEILNVLRQIMDALDPNGLAWYLVALTRQHTLEWYLSVRPNTREMIGLEPNSIMSLHAYPCVSANTNC